MPSNAYQDLISRLKDIDEIIAARDAICPANAGRPAQRKGAAVINGGTVLLSAIFEGFVEDLYDAAVDILYASAPAADRKKLKENTSAKNHNANIHQVNNLFFYVGIPWIMSHNSICWQKYSNTKIQETLGHLSKARNQLAHGSHHKVLKKNLVFWKYFIERLSLKLDEIVALEIESRTGKRPW